jgi:hypothetical protein
MNDKTETLSRRTALKRLGAGISTGMAGLALADPAAASHRRKMVIRGDDYSCTCGTTHYRVKIFGDSEVVSDKTESEDEHYQSGDYTIIDGYVGGDDKDVWWFDNDIVEVFAEVADSSRYDSSRIGFTFSGDFDYTARDRVSFKSSASGSDQHQEYYVEAKDSISKTSNCESCDNWRGDCVDGNSAQGYVLEYRDTYKKSGMIGDLTLRLRDRKSITMSHY